MSELGSAETMQFTAAPPVETKPPQSHLIKPAALREVLIRDQSRYTQPDRDELGL